MNKQQIIYALENIVMQDALMTKLEKAFEIDLNEYSYSYNDIYENFFGIETSKFDIDTEQKYNDCFVEPLHKKELSYREKAERIYSNITTLIEVDSKVLKEFPTYKLEGTLKIVA